ncbi:MAG: hypothetical protein ACOYK8_03575 [Alphaproteobacteria bacterium]
MSKSLACNIINNCNKPTQAISRGADALIFCDKSRKLLLTIEMISKICTEKPADNSSKEQLKNLLCTIDSCFQELIRVIFPKALAKNYITGHLQEASMALAQLQSHAARLQWQWAVQQNNSPEHTSDTHYHIVMQKALFHLRRNIVIMAENLD